MIALASSKDASFLLLPWKVLQETWKIIYMEVSYIKAYGKESHLTLDKLL
jgi:hypothetical protein